MADRDLGISPYVGEGADGCLRSAQIDRDEAATFPTGSPEAERLLERAQAWERIAASLDALGAGGAIPERDPRNLGGKITSPGGPYDRHGAVIDTRRAVLHEHTSVALVEPYRDGQAGSLVIALELEGRINKTTDRALVLYLTDEDGAAAIITELVGVVHRAGGKLAPAFMQRLQERLKALP